MINKKELEIELTKKGVDDIKSVFQIIEELERKIFELEKRVTKLEESDLRHHLMHIKME